MKRDVPRQDHHVGGQWELENQHRRSVVSNTLRDILRRRSEYL